MIHEEGEGKKRKYKVYIRQTTQKVKKRITEAKSDMNIESKKNSTRLSNYIWQLKEEKISFKVEWEIIMKAKEYKKGGKTCNLCSKERLKIMEQDRRTLLNSRDEVITECFHKRRHKLEVYNGKETESIKKANKDRIEEKEEGQGDDWNERESEEARTEGNRIKVKWKEGEKEIEDLGDREGPKKQEKKE